MISLVLLRVTVIVALVMLVSPSNAQLTFNFYSSSCSSAATIVRNVVISAVKNESRMAASLLRLHFHDCFVNGCDASVLLDDTTTMMGEKTAFPNRNSLRGFEVVDEAKAAIEKACPGMVSCADILAIAARDAVVLAGGAAWSVLLGRRDSVTASATAANNALPAPTETLATIIAKFKAVGLNELDLAALSGAHTIGRGRCANVTPRLYNFNGTGQQDPTLEAAYGSTLQAACPSAGGDTNALVALDPMSPDRFDNNYFKDLQARKGLFSSDQELLSTPGASTIAAFIQTFAASPLLFSVTFASSMQKMGNISPLTGAAGGQIRRNCHVVNPS